jgi:hypothetical protein
VLGTQIPAHRGRRPRSVIRRRTGQSRCLAKQREANERAINAAIQKGDVADFKALVADDGAAMDGTGVMPVSEFVKEYAQIKLQTFTIDQVEATTGQAMPSPVWASTTYANRGGKWVAIFHQETIPSPPPPPAKK